MGQLMNKLCNRGNKEIDVRFIRPVLDTLGSRAKLQTGIQMNLPERCLLFRNCVWVKPVGT